MKPDVDVLVLGAGMVGATLAARLAGSGLRVVVADAAALPPALPDPAGRTSAVNRRSEALLRDLGAWTRLPPGAASPFVRMQVWEHRGGTIAFDAADIGEPHLGHIVFNDALVAALGARLDDAGIEVRRECAVHGIRLGDEAVEVQFAEGEPVVRARLLVGADGGRSTVRVAAGIRLRARDYGQRAIVTNVVTGRPHDDTARQVFHPEGPLAFLPLADGRSSVVWSCEANFAHTRLALAGNEFHHALAEAFDGRMGEILESTPRQSFPLQLAHASRYIAHRVALIGDAAHTVHPLAGQGVNLGIGDAALLADLLGDAARRGRDPGAHLLLRRYERGRKGENLGMSAALDGLQRLFALRPQPLRAVRAFGLAATDRSGPIKRRIIRLAAGVD